MCDVKFFVDFGRRIVKFVRCVFRYQAITSKYRSTSLFFGFISNRFNRCGFILFFLLLDYIVSLYMMNEIYEWRYVSVYYFQLLFPCSLAAISLNWLWFLLCFRRLTATATEVSSSFYFDVAFKFRAIGENLLCCSRCLQSEVKCISVCL